MIQTLNRLETMLGQVQNSSEWADAYTIYVPYYFHEILVTLDANEYFTWQQRTCLGLFLKLRSAILRGINLQRQYAIARIEEMLEEMRGDNWSEVPK